MMLNWLEQCRRVYNYALAERKDWINSRTCAINACSIHSEYIIAADTLYPNYYTQKRNLTQARNEIPELKAVHSQVLQDVLGGLEKSFCFMQERGFGFPRFKKFGQYRSFLFPQFTDNPITGHQIKLPKIGMVLINFHRPIPEGFAVKQVRIVRKASGWYAIVLLQTNVSIPDIIPQGNSIGIELGLKKFLAVSMGKLVEHPRCFLNLQSKLKWLQRKLKNKQCGSHNYRKQQHKIAKLHEHIHNLRREFQFDIAHQLCNGVGMIFAQDSNPKVNSYGMQPNQFLEILQWVCFKRGVFFLKVDSKQTSQICPNCGARSGKKHSQNLRTDRKETEFFNINSTWKREFLVNEFDFYCSECGYTTDRDVAAAQVVEQRGLAAVGYMVKVPVEASASALR
ncbi:MAG: transposase [Gloeotrichia echinulata IR180]